MRRVNIYLMILAMILFSASVSAAAGNEDLSFADARITGLSGAYTAVSDDSNALYRNPAGLNNLTGSSMSLRLDGADTISALSMIDPNGMGLFVDPQLSGEFLYTTRNFGLSVVSKYFMEIEPVSGGYQFDVIKRNSLQVGTSLGLGPLSLGATIRATKEDTRQHIEVPSDEPVGILIPFLQNVILGDYSSTLARERVVMGVGALLNLGSFSVGAYSDEFIDFMYNQTSEIKLDVDTILRDLTVGVAYQSPTYDSFGNYRALQFTAAADLARIGDDLNRKISIGTEANLRFLQYMQLSVRLGYQEPVEQLDELLFGLSLTEGDYSIGVGAVLPFLKFDAALMIPSEALLYNLSPSGEYVGEEVLAQITFGFAL